MASIPGSRNRKRRRTDGSSNTFKPVTAAQFKKNIKKITLKLVLYRWNSSKNLSEKETWTWAFLYHIIKHMITAADLYNISSSNINLPNNRKLNNLNRIFPGDPIVVAAMGSIDKYIYMLHERLTRSPNVLFGDKIIKKEYKLSIEEVAIFTVLRYLDMSHDRTIGGMTLDNFLNRSPNLHGLPDTIKSKVVKYIYSVYNTNSGYNNTTLGKICSIAMGDGTRGTTLWKAKSNFEANLRSNIPLLFPGIQEPVTMNVNSSAVQGKILNAFGCKKVSISLDQEGETRNLSNLIKNNPRINNRIQVTSLLDPGHGMLKQVGFEADYRKFFGINNTFNSSVSTYSLFSFDVTFTVDGNVYYKLAISHNKPTNIDQESMVIRHRIGSKSDMVNVTPVSKKVAAASNNAGKAAKFFGDNAQVVVDTILGRIGFAHRPTKCYADASGDGMYIVYKAAMATVMENSIYRERKIPIPVNTKYVRIMMFADKSGAGNTSVDFYYWLPSNGKILNNGNLLRNNLKGTTPAFSNNSLLTARTRNTGKLVTVRKSNGNNAVSQWAIQLYAALWNRNKNAIRELKEKNNNVYKQLKSIRFKPSNYKNISMNTRLNWLNNLKKLPVNSNQYINHVQKLNLALGNNINLFNDPRGLTDAQTFALLVKNKNKLKNIRMTRSSSKIRPLVVATSLRNNAPQLLNIASRLNNNTLIRIYNSKKNSINDLKQFIKNSQETSGNSTMS